MNQRSVLPAWRLRREPATTTAASFSAAASARRSRCPAAGAPAPRSSWSNSSLAAQEKRSCCRPASQQSLGNWEPSPGPAPPGPAVPAGATPQELALVRAGKSNFGTRRVLQAGDASPSARKVPEGVTWRKCGLSPTAASLKPEVYMVAWETGRGARAAASHTAEPTEARRTGAPWRS